MHFKPEIISGQLAGAAVRGLNDSLRNKKIVILGIKFIP
jgi:hypothetical protein